MKNLNRIRAGLECQYCNSDTELVNSSVIYGKDYGDIYLCKPCDAYVGVHEGTTKAKGTVANAELRDQRKTAHAFFDPLWMKKVVTRKALYKGLSNWLEKSPDETHIGMFDTEECDEVIKYALHVKRKGIPYGLERDKAKAR